MIRSAPARPVRRILRGEKTFDHRASVRIQVFRHLLPIKRLHPAGNVFGRGDRQRFFDQVIHACASFSSSARLRSTPQR